MTAARLLREAAGDCVRAAIWLEGARDQTSVENAKAAARLAAAALGRAELALCKELAVREEMLSTPENV